jgi:hypothetical protein
MRAIAVVLMALGFLVLLVGGIRFTHRQEIAHVGHATVTAPAAPVSVVPRLGGAALLAAGAALLATTARRRPRV